MKVIDIHTHGIGGYDTRSKTEDDILKIAEIHGSYGISEIVLTLYPSSIEGMRRNMMTIKKAMEKQSSSASGGLSPQSSALILGIHLEGPFLNPSQCGALDAKAFIEPTEYHFRELLEGFEDIVKIITIAPEIRGATKLIKKVSGRGIIVSMGHSEL